MVDGTTRALYNALRLSPPSSKIASWKLQDFRAISLDVLFSDLSSLGLTFDAPTFIAWAEECDAPEELVSLLLADSLDELSEETIDHIFLVLFELWRRLIPERRSISILADELDHLIFLYDEGDDGVVDALTNTFQEFLRFLQRAQDTGLDPGQVFQASLPYFAHDIMRFFFDFIEEQMEEGDGWANGLIEDFYPFFSEKAWLDCLRIKIIGTNDPKRGAHLAKEFISKLNLSEVDGRILALSILEAATKLQDEKLLSQVIRELVPEIEEKEELQDLVDILSYSFQNEALPSEEEIEKKPLEESKKKILTLF